MPHILKLQTNEFTFGSEINSLQHNKIFLKLFTNCPENNADKKLLKKKKALLIKIAINIVLEEQINEFSCHKMSQNTVIIITNLATQIVCYAMKRAKHENLASLTGSPVEIHLKPMHSLMHEHAFLFTTHKCSSDRKSFSLRQLSRLETTVLVASILV